MNIEYRDVKDFTEKVRIAVEKAKAEGNKQHPVHSAKDKDLDIDTENIFGNDRSFKVLCIGASTGGPTAVQKVLAGLGNNFPLPILYTQHIEVKKDKPLADWLDQVCKNVKVKLAEDGEEAQPGEASGALRNPARI